VSRTAVLVILLAVPAAASAQQSAAPDSTDSPVSAERIVDGLKRPQLEIPPLPQMPTFRTAVEARKLETALEAVRRELAEEYGRGGKEQSRVPGAATALASVDVWPAIVGLYNKIQDIRREHAEANAREMVSKELAAFCAAHDCAAIQQGQPIEGLILPQ
jgi:hypothetical protein